VEPPPALTREIYPEVDEWLAEMEAFRPGSAHNEVERHDLAGSGFLRLFRVLRTVFLQDSVILRPLFPDHPIWKADVLATAAYRAFATQVTAACYWHRYVQFLAIDRNVLHARLRRSPGTSRSRRPSRW
jgi:centromere DNA-binding complex CBF3 subunit-like protein